MKTLAEMDGMLGELDRLEAKVKALRSEANSADGHADQLRMQILTELTNQGVNSFKGTVGQVSIVTRHHVKFPSDPEVRAELRKYLEEKDQFDALWQIHHQKLNSFFKQEMELTQEKGEYLDIPGLNPVSEKSISFRRAAS